MALSKTVLGAALLSATTPFNDKTEAQLITTYGSLAAARLAAFEAQAQAIIDHFKNNAELHVPGTGLTAGATAVTGSSNSGTIT